MNGRLRAVLGLITRFQWIGAVVMGIVFVFYTGDFIGDFLHKTTFLNHVRDLNQDDAFYYFNIARHFSDGAFSTFDGIHLTNGYHPLWVAMLTSVYFVTDDPAAALETIKVMEFVILLLSFLFLLSGAACIGGYWVLLAGVCPLLLSNKTLFCGMENSALLLVSTMLFAALACQSRFGRSRVGGVGIMIAVALLPWARLEAVSISLSLPVLLAVLRHLKVVDVEKRQLLACAVSAWASLLVYLLYNYLVFDSALPVSGLVKTDIFSAYLWKKQGGFDVWTNIRETWALEPYRSGVVSSAMIGGIAVVSLLIRALKKQPGASVALDVFMICLAIGHVSKFLHAALAVHPSYSAAEWYFSYKHLIDILFWPYLFAAVGAVFWMCRPPVLKAAAAAVVMAGSVHILWNADFNAPFAVVDDISRQTLRNWRTLSYQGAQLLDSTLPEGAVVGATDAGILGYFSKHAVVNLDGLVNSKSFFDAVESGDISEWVKQSGIRYLANVLPTKKKDGAYEFGRRATHDRALRGKSRLLFEGFPIYGGKKEFKLWAYAWEEPLRTAFKQDSVGTKAFFDAAFENASASRKGRFEVFLKNDILGYRKLDCTAADTSGKFFLYVTVADSGALPPKMRAKKTFNFPFDWSQYGYRSDDTCMAIVTLPPYPLKRVSTGQYETGDSDRWTARFDL